MTIIIDEAYSQSENSGQVRQWLKRYPESVTSLANIPVKPTSAPTRGDNWVRF